MVHQIQTRRALVTDRDGTEVAVLVAADGDRVDLVTLGGRTVTVTVAEPGRLREVLARPDLTRRDGHPLVLVSVRYRLLAAAFGPAEPPGQLVVNGVVDIDSVPPVVPAAEDDQPSWACLDLVSDGTRPTADVPVDGDRIAYSEGETCPVCRSERVVDIVYGMPGPGLMERSQRGEVALGGCCIGGDDPTHRCLGCGTDLWSRPLSRRRSSAN